MLKKKRRQIAIKIRSSSASACVLKKSKKQTRQLITSDGFNIALYLNKELMADFAH